MGRQRHQRRLPAPMFVATDSSGTASRYRMVGAGIDGRKGDVDFGKRFLFFGTGRYLTTGRRLDAAPQSWYGLVDDRTR